MVYPAEMDHLPSTPQLDKALKWTALKHASFKLNSLKRIDESLVSGGEGEGRHGSLVSGEWGVGA